MTLDLSRDDLITLELFEIQRKPLAILVAESAAGRNAAWLPRASIVERVLRRGVLAITLPRVLAGEKGLLTLSDTRQSELFGGTEREAHS